MSSRVRVVLADDHKMLREALRALLDQETDIEVQGEAGDGESVLKLAAETRPDIVVMDIAMPGLNGAEATRRLAVQHPDIKVIALSANSCPHDLNGICQRVAGALCDPGMRGCVLHGKVKFAEDAKKLSRRPVAAQPTVPPSKATRKPKRTLAF